METVALSRRAIREKLMNPPNGRDSSELEVTSEASLRRIEREASLLQKEEDERKAHKARVALIVEQIKQRKEEWREAEVAWLQLLVNRGLTATRIADICCKHFKVNPLEVIGLRRRAYICYARHIIAYLCCTETKRSLPEIGRFLDRDHTTILHSRNLITARLAAGDLKLTADIAALRQLLGVV